MIVEIERIKQDSEKICDLASDIVFKIRYTQNSPNVIPLDDMLDKLEEAVEKFNLDIDIIDKDLSEISDFIANNKGVLND